MKLTALKTAISTTALAVSGIGSFKFGSLADINDSDTTTYDLFLLVYPALTGNPHTRSYKQKNYRFDIYLFRKVDKDTAGLIDDKLTTGWEAMQTEIDTFFTNLIANYGDIAVGRDLTFEYDYGKIGAELLQWIQVTVNLNLNDCS